MPNLPAAPLAHKRNSPQSPTNTFVDSTSEVHSERLISITSFRCRGFSEAKDGEQADVDSVAVEDVDTSQDVLSEKPSMLALLTMRKAAQLDTYEETSSVASVLLVVGGAVPAVRPLAIVVLALDGLGSARLQLGGGSGGSAGNGGGDEEDLGELHVC